MTGLSSSGAAAREGAAIRAASLVSTRRACASARTSTRRPSSSHRSRLCVRRKLWVRTPRSRVQPAYSQALTPLRTLTCTLIHTASSLRRSSSASIGADIIIPLDELPPNGVTGEALARSVALSHRWMARSLREHLKQRREQAMYGVIHGGTDQALRRASVGYLSSLPFDGFAVGGSLGRDRAEMLELLRFVMPLLPASKPNHLLGIADPRSVESIAPLGVDTFDSCYPTRVARHGTLLTRGGMLHIGQGKYRSQFGPIDPAMPTIECSRAYLHHLYRMKEPLYQTLASMHNVRYMMTLMADLRERIRADEL